MCNPAKMALHVNKVIADRERERLHREACERQAAENDLIIAEREFFKTVERVANPPEDRSKWPLPVKYPKNPAPADVSRDRAALEAEIARTGYRPR